MMANTGAGQLAGAPSRAPRATKCITSRFRMPVYGIKPSDITSQSRTPNDLRLIAEQRLIIKEKKSTYREVYATLALVWSKFYRINSSILIS